MKTAAQTPDPIADTAAVVNRLLGSIENSPSEAAIVAFMAAIRRNGRELIEVAGPGGLEAVLAKIRDDAGRRERIVLEAWDGLVSEGVA